MTKYVALLRGIGPLNPKMRNEKLRGVFENLGFTNVQTVMSSGNVLFDANSKDMKALEAAVEKALPAQLGFTSTTIIRSRDELQELVDKNPFRGIEDTPKSRLNVTFLKNPPKAKLKFPYRVENKTYELLGLYDRAICKELRNMTEVDERDGDRSMAKVVWHVTMSLDGFIAGPDDTVDWIFEYDAGRNPIAEEATKTTGAILAGRRWYDLAMSRLGGTAGIYGGAWTGPVFVLTHQPPGPPDDPAITFLSDGIDNAVAVALAAAKGKNIVLFGATIPRQCLVASLVDEILIHLAPVLLGDGIRLYGSPGAGRVNLEPTHVGQSGQLTDLRFRVVK